MLTVNIHEAKTQLSKLIAQASAKGEGFVIAKAGKPLVKVVPLDAPTAPKRLGFLEGDVRIPEDFNRMGEREIASLFGVQTESPELSRTRKKTIRVPRRK